MAAFECPTCHQQRAKQRGGDCNICWLLKDLRDEHSDGFHRDKPNPSCTLCKPRQAELLESHGASAYIRRVTAPPMSLKKAKILLKADREGFEYFTRHGARGSHVMLQLAEEGHLKVEFDEDGRVPLGVIITSHARERAIELLASSQHTGDTSSARQGRAQRPKTTSPRAAMSHADCKHDRTAKARAKCRAERKANA